MLVKRKENREKEKNCRKNRYEAIVVHNNSTDSKEQAQARLEQPHDIKFNFLTF